MNATPRFVLLLERHATLLALAMTAAGLLLRAVSIADYWLSPDEGIYWSSATRPFAKAWPEILGNAHPPLFYLLLRGVALLSIEPWCLRLPSLLCGTAAIWVLFVAGRTFAGPIVGLAAAALLAFGPDTIVYSQIVRPYAMLTLVGAWWLVHAARSWRSPGSHRDPALFGVALLVMILLHYGAAELLAASSLVCAIAAIATRFARPSVRLLVWHAPAWIALAVCYQWHVRPLMGAGGLVADITNGFVRPYFASSAQEAWRALVGSVAHFTFAPLATPGLVVLALGVAALARGGARWLAAVCAASYALALLACCLGKYPLGATRHALHLLPLALLAIGGAFAFVLSNWRRLLIGGAALVLLGALAPRIERLTGVGEQSFARVNERPITVEEHAAVAHDLRTLKQTRGTIICDLQSWYLVLPDFGEDALRAEFRGPPTHLHFRWGARDVIVHHAWGTSWSPDGAGQPSHILTLLRGIEPLLAPSLELLGADCYVVSGGWELPPQLKFAVFPALDREWFKTIVPAATLGRALSGLHVDLRQFVRAYERLLAARAAETRPK